MSYNASALRRFTNFITERERIRKLKESGADFPWTKDKILSTYSFCNVHREDDRVTKWIAQNWRKPHEHHTNIWFAMMVARLVNWPDTLALFNVQKDILQYKPDKLISKVNNIPGKKWGSAYIVSTNGLTMEKADYIFGVVLRKAWEERTRVCPKQGMSLREFYERLVALPGMGTFMAAQVVADTKYTPVFEGAPDWETFAAPGPGSKRGMLRMLHGESYTPKQPRHSITDTEWQRQIGILHERFSHLMHAQDLQNCLCEFDKYERTRLGQGKPKVMYKVKHNG